METNHAKRSANLVAQASECRRHATSVAEDRYIRMLLDEARREAELHLEADPSARVVRKFEDVWALADGSVVQFLDADLGWVAAEKRGDSLWYAAGATDSVDDYGITAFGGAIVLWEPVDAPAY